jgi:hypothetical protein
MTRMLTWRRCPGRLRPSSAAAVASLGAGRGLGPWLTAVDVRPRPRCARGFRSRTSSLHQVSLGLCEGELGTWGDPRVNDGGACASPHSKPLAENPRARCGRSRCRREALAVPARGARGAGEARFVGARTVAGRVCVRSVRIRSRWARISAGCRRYFIGGAYCSPIASRVRGWRGTRRSGEPEKIPNSP